MELNPQDFIHDSGPVYHEFVYDAFIKEPWNAFSSLFFLVPVIFWLWKIRGKYKTYPMITVLLPLLFLNGIGSTFYHAFRNSELMLLLDWVPPFIMNLFLMWYFWNKVIRKPFVAVLLVVGSLSITILVMFFFARNLGAQAANMGYFMIGLSLFIPIVTYLFRSNFYGWYLLVITFVILALALLFRSMDYPTPNPFPHILPQGTHFLWHVTSAFAVFSLGYYFKKTRDRELSDKS